jgi:ribose 5-phosphate isomerase A
MDTESWKIYAAESAARLVRDGMVVGLGSGTTVAKLIRELVEAKPDAIFIPSSSETQALAEKMGLRLSSLDTHGKLDLMIDGADEIDKNFDMIKGHGGAHTREKIVAGAAKRVAIIVDRTKLVKKLGDRFPVPVEVLPFALRYTMSKLESLGGKAKLRTGATGTPFITDNGNYLVDLKFESIPKPAKLERDINHLPGVIENGIFSGVPDEVFVGYERGCVVLRSRRDFTNFSKQAGEAILSK